MVLINKAINEDTVKLVYYGPGLCGKTTNLEKIYANPRLDNKGKMISMSTETDRTLFFDFMPMELGTIAGQKVRVQLYTVPGQVFYDATRKLVLRGSDGVVFVADSQESMKESNLDSLKNLRTNLRVNRIDPDKVALVFQYNKRDLPNVSSVEEMSAYMHPGDSPVVEASAITGAGVTATLRAAVSRILENLKNNVDTTLYEEPPLTAPDMSQKAGVAAHSAGTPKLSMRSESPALNPQSSILNPQSAPVAHVEAEPFDTGEVAVEVEVDPFDATPEPEAPSARFAAFDDPFSAPVKHDDPERAELEELVANARAVVATLEVALERARENERVLTAKLAR